MVWTPQGGLLPKAVYVHCTTLEASCLQRRTVPSRKTQGPAYAAAHGGPVTFPLESHSLCPKAPPTPRPLTSLGPPHSLPPNFFVSRAPGPLFYQAPNSSVRLKPFLGPSEAQSTSSSLPLFFIPHSDSQKLLRNQGLASHSSWTQLGLWSIVVHKIIGEESDSYIYLSSMLSCYNGRVKSLQ